MIRLGVQLGSAYTPGSRWRHIVGIVGGFVAVWCGLVTVSLLYLNSTEGQREFERTGVIAETSADTIVDVLQRFDNIDGEQFSVNWLAPTPQTNEVGEFMPGVTSLPAVGSFLVSPALDRLLASSDASRYDQRQVLPESAVRSGEELIAFATLPESERASVVDDLIPIGGFGAQPNTVGSFSFGIVDANSQTTVLLGAASFLILPGIALLLVAATANSPVLIARLGVLDWLGANRRRRSVLIASETVVGVAPGIILGVVTWSWWATRAERLSLVDTAVFQGDLKSPWIIVLAIAAATLLAAVLLAVLNLIGRKSTTLDGPRPTRVLRRSKWMLPVGVVGIGLLVTGATAERFGPRLYVGMFLTILALPSMTRTLTAALGAAVADIDRPTALLAGRRASRGSERSARLMSALGMFVFVGMLVVGFRAASSTDDPPPRDGQYESLTVQTNLTDGQVASIVANLPAETQTIPLRQGVDGELVAHYQCLSDRACLDTPRLAAIIGVPPELLTVTDTPQDADQDSDLLLVGPRTDQFTGAAKDAIVRAVPSAAFFDESDLLKKSSPLDQWLTAGLTALAVVAAAAFGFGIIDRYVADQKQATALTVIGLSPKRVASIETTQFALSYVATAGLSAVIGTLAVVALAATGSTNLPVQGLVTILIVVAAILAASTLAVWALVSRAATTSIDQRPASRRWGSTPTAA